MVSCVLYELISVTGSMPQIWSTSGRDVCQVLRERNIPRIRAVEESGLLLCAGGGGECTIKWRVGVAW